MSTHAQSPSDATQLCHNFIKRHGKNMHHHAVYLEHVEDQAEKNRRENGKDAESAVPGMYEQQARYLFDTLDWMYDVAGGAKIKNTNSQERMELQQGFMKSLAALNMVINEHKDFSKHLEAASHPEAAEQEYRNIHEIEDFKELSQEERLEIADNIRSNKDEIREIKKTLTELSAMYHDMKQLQAAVIGGFPKIGGKSDGQGRGK